MLKKLFSLLGYVPKEEVTQNLNQLKESTALMDRARIVIKGLKKNIKILEKAVITKNKELQSIISKSDYKVKQLNAKNLRLLRKQGEFKEEIKKLTIVNEELTKDYQELFKNALSSMRQGEYYKVISEAAIEKLEYLCFGSVLPKALRPSSLDRYQHLYKPVTPTYFKDRYGRPAIGVEYGHSED
jgi:hypothetical protein